MKVEGKAMRGGGAVVWTSEEEEEVKDMVFVAVDGWMDGIR